MKRIRHTLTVFALIAGTATYWWTVCGMPGLAIGR